ncbi:CASC3/Barentsz eIF4AIII binding, putative isoform 3 [Hibiscus syriacus]|uniref:CASC3/Barentsz eIF4AIII binding, putative isoform 3 n=1 Tax=Hibiscus syriacus TaxID=106335 RepID=A0A6A2WW71_HIBSY|nr:CASC3/Barentsz eIF4AIII binding, putative isoform 3 [Hibiscus syriacus]
MIKRLMMRTHGERKLWESKDDRKWGHDKFEEMNSQEKHYEDGGRSSQGRYRARSKNRDPDSAYSTGSRPKAFGKSNNQNHASKAVKGRGPRMYEPTMRKRSQAPPALNKLYGKPHERTSQANSSRVFIPETNADTVSVPASKPSLGSASPPFYPSGSSNKYITSTQKKDMQAGNISRKFHPSVTDENFSVLQSNSLQGKNVLDSLSMAKLYIDDSSMSASVKFSTNVQLGNTGQLSHYRVQGKGVAIPGKKAYQLAPHQNQVNPQPTQVNSVQRSPVQGRALSSVQATAQQLGQHPGIGSQASSPPKTAMPVSSYESGEVESSETNKSKGALVSKGKSSAQGAGRSSFLYGGAQIMGATGSPAFLPDKTSDRVFIPGMQVFFGMCFFLGWLEGGQHPGGLSVPLLAWHFLDMLPSRNLHGSGRLNLLVFNCIDCHSFPSAFPTGKITLTSNLAGNWKPSKRTVKQVSYAELVSDEFGQRQPK